MASDGWLDRFLEIKDSGSGTLRGYVETPADVRLRDEISVLRRVVSRTSSPLVVWPTTRIPGGGHSESILVDIGSFLQWMVAHGLEADTIADFLDVNRKPWPIVPDLVFDDQMVWLRPEECNT